MKLARSPAPAAAVLAAALAAGCAAKNPAPAVPVEAAKKSDSRALAGKWSGDYVSPDNGRRGSIVFQFKSGGAEGYGDVLMWPVGSKDAGQSAAQAEKTMPQVLKIESIRSEGGYVTGAMSTYKDPDCDCDVHTTFSGSIDGDVIVGEFTIERFDKKGLKAKGTWKVTREKA
jgi:hypothetical protein